MHKKYAKVCQVCLGEFNGTTRARFCELCRSSRHKDQNKQWRISHPNECYNFSEKWRNKNPDKWLEARRNSTAKRRLKDPGHFERLKANCKEYYIANRERLLKDKQIYHIENREEINTKTRAWQERNRDKIRAYNLKNRTRDEISIETIKEVFRDYNFGCMYCGVKHSLSLEHILPISRGGDNSFENLGVACRSCNSSKGKKTILEFSEWRALSTTLNTTPSP